MERHRCPGWVAPVVTLELGGEDAIDVLKHDEVGLAGFDAPLDVGEEVALVVVPGPLPGAGEGLAGEAAREDEVEISRSSQSLKWKPLEIREHRSGSQVSRFNLFNQVRAGEGFDLHINPRARTDSTPFEAEVDAPVAGA